MGESDERRKSMSSWSSTSWEDSWSSFSKGSLKIVGKRAEEEDDKMTIAEFTQSRQSKGSPISTTPISKFTGRKVTFGGIDREPQSYAAPPGFLPNSTEKPKINLHLLKEQRKDHIIIGIVVGLVVAFIFVGILVFGCCCYTKYVKKKTLRDNPHHPERNSVRMPRHL